MAIEVQDSGMLIAAGAVSVTGSPALLAQGISSWEHEAAGSVLMTLTQPVHVSELMTFASNIGSAASQFNWEAATVSPAGEVTVVRLEMFDGDGTQVNGVACFEIKRLPRSLVTQIV